MLRRGVPPVGLVVTEGELVELGHAASLDQLDIARDIDRGRVEQHVALQNREFLSFCLEESLVGPHDTCEMPPAECPIR